MPTQSRRAGDTVTHGSRRDDKVDCLLVDVDDTEIDLEDGALEIGSMRDDGD